MLFINNVDTGVHYFIIIYHEYYKLNNYSMTTKIRLSILYINSHVVSFKFKNIHIIGTAFLTSYFLFYLCIIVYGLLNMFSLGFKHNNLKTKRQHCYHFTSPTW